MASFVDETLDLCKSFRVENHFNRIWTQLPSELKSQFEAASVHLRFKRGDTIYRQGDQPRGLYLIQKGLVGLMLLGSSSGKEHLVRFFREDQYFGHRALFSAEGYHGNATALEPTDILMIPKNTVLSVLDQNPILYKDVASVLARELRHCEVQHVMILENQIISRTALALVYLKDLHPEHRWTRQEIANFCASTVSTVIKALSELEGMGFIEQNGRSIEILNRNALIALQDQNL